LQIESHTDFISKPISCIKYRLAGASFRLLRRVRTKDT
jgi:hypothetical protein